MFTRMIVRVHKTNYILFPSIWKWKRLNISFVVTVGSIYSAESSLKAQNEAVRKEGGGFHSHTFSGRLMRLSLNIS